MKILARVNLAAGKSSKGQVAFEEVLAEQVGSNRYRLLKSPGLVLGLAADDEFELAEGGEFRLIERGLNLCIQIFRQEGIELCQQYLEPELRSLKGRIDGVADSELVLTIPVATGFEATEELMRRLQDRFPDSEWYYGNVYDKDGVTPLNWWA